MEIGVDFDGPSIGTKPLVSQQSRLQETVELGCSLEVLIISSLSIAPK